MGQEEYTETYEAIFEACEEGILVVSKKGVIALANEASHLLFGYEQGELIGMQIESLVPPALRHSHVKDRQEYEEHPSPRQMGKGRDLLGRRKNGDDFPVEISLNRAQIDGVDHTVAFVIDITERKKIEEALKRSEEQLIVYAAELEKRVTQRTRELDQTISQLEKANKELEEQITIRKKAEEETKVALSRERELNELKSRFVSMASHEFRTPLSTILSSASLIERYTAPDTEDKRKKHIHKIKSSINNLTGILNDFLSLSKLEEGKVELINEDIELMDMLRDVVDEMDAIVKDGQKIHIDTEEEEYYLYSDKKTLKNILINLLSNAIKYSEPGGEVIVKVLDMEEKLLLQVVDQGIGIPEEEQKHMFERFFRASNVTNIQGTGLGLNIVKKYVDMLNGDISFESKFGEGTTFTIVLPK
ncbi:two-component sensor histidine kinase [Fulvivirga imtechensis AK7]|uniref:histidine kinase n=1 Tax=Fulvivirga imtechensis AK7 TaxID=1237149 RepID=L8JSP8_9BACT|nr:PAS domain-containing sensor histidine kinase [Fulvivirga imtechensis]ELR71996.1 two-component sensor histidine kinase [Fulvivirga imtechensis AK7]